MYLQRASKQKEQVVARWHLYYKTELSAKDRSMLAHAMKLAATSSSRKRLGAILVSGGRVVGRGTNRVPNDTALIGWDATTNSTHAEIAALRDYGSSMKNGTIYVARLGKSGIPRMSKPCKKCQKALRDAGVKKVVYTVDNEMEL